jgi:hypothetical protein
MAEGYQHPRAPAPVAFGGEKREDDQRRDERVALGVLHGAQELEQHERASEQCVARR